MSHLDAKIFIVVTFAALAASVLAHVLGWRYRRAMQVWMQAAIPATAAAQARTNAQTEQTASAALAAEPAAPVTLADNRRAAWRVTALMLLLTLLVALASAVVTFLLPGTGATLTLRRALVLGVAQTWPAIPVLGLLWRWPPGRMLAALLAWAALAAAVMALNSDGPHPLRDGFVYLAADAGFALLWAMLLCVGATARAIAPWLLLPLAAALAAAVAGLDLLAAATEAPANWLYRLVGALGAWPTMLLFVLVPLGVFAWPARVLGQWLAAAYRRRWLSELTTLFGMLTGLALLERTLTSLGSSGGRSVALLLPLLLIPLVVWLASTIDPHRRSQMQQQPRAPVLLVLRVFQRDRAVSALFDLVIERWRLTGNTVLIAGTDLLARTIDAEDIYAFIGGRLRERFVLTPADLAPRIADFEFRRDADGRHRVNEVYCHDQTWQAALDALVACADVVLMDLRSFQKHNRGCRYELGVLARAPHLTRVVVLVDKDTDRADAEQAAAGAPPGRFEWVALTEVGRGLAQRVLRRLFVAG
jgi:hypothetical protein